MVTHGMTAPTVASPPAPAAGLLPSNPSEKTRQAARGARGGPAAAAAAADDGDGAPPPGRRCPPVRHRHSVDDDHHRHNAGGGCRRHRLAGAASRRCVIAYGGGDGAGGGGGGIDDEVKAPRVHQHPLPPHQLPGRTAASRHLDGHRRRRATDHPCRRTVVGGRHPARTTPTPRSCATPAWAVAAATTVVMGLGARARVERTAWPSRSPTPVLRTPPTPPTTTRHVAGKVGRRAHRLAEARQRAKDGHLLWEAHPLPQDEGATTGGS